MPYYSYALAVGYNNAAGLVNVENIIPTGGTRFYPPDSYGRYDPGQVRIRADGAVYLAGFASTTWLFKGITRLQYDYLSDTYCGSSIAGKVTIRTLTNDPSTYANFNAILILPKLVDLRKVTSGFADCNVRLVRLEGI